MVQTWPAGGAIRLVVILTQLASCTLCIARSCILRINCKARSRNDIASSSSLPKNFGATVVASTPITMMVMMSSTSVKPRYFTLLNARCHCNYWACVSAGRIVIFNRTRCTASRWRRSRVTSMRDRVNKYTAR